MPHNDRYIHDRALDLFRNRHMTLDDAILIAGSEYAEQQRKLGRALDADERVAYSWRPGVGRMVGSQRNG